MGRLFSLGLFALALGIPTGIALISLQTEALVSKPGEASLADFKHAQTLIERYDPRRMPPEQITKIQATSDELDTIIKGAFSGVEKIATRIKVTRFGVIAAMTAELPIPENPLGRYLNIRTVIAPSLDGLEISRFAIGSMEISPAVIKPVLLYALNKLTGDGNGQPILDSIRSVEVAEREVTIAFLPPPDLIETLKKAPKQHAAVSNPKMVRRYYREIEDVLSEIPSGQQVSLMEVIRPVFQLAQSRSRKLDPIRENEAALLALAIQFGDPRFERFVGEVRSTEDKSSQRSGP